MSHAFPLCSRAVCGLDGEGGEGFEGKGRQRRRARLVEKARGELPDAELAGGAAALPNEEDLAAGVEDKRADAELQTERRKGRSTGGAGSAALRTGGAGGGLQNDRGRARRGDAKRWAPRRKHSTWDDALGGSVDGVLGSQHVSMT